MHKRTILVTLLVAAWAGCGAAPTEPAVTPEPSAADVKAEEARARLEAAGDGGALVLRAIAAHGGLEAWYAAPTSSYHWEYSNDGAQLRFKTYVVVENDTRRAYHEFKTLGTPGDPEPYEGRMAWDGAEAWVHPADTPKINPRFWSLTGFYFEQIPFVLADPGLKYEKLPDAELDGESCDMVKVSFDSGIGDAPGDTYTLYLDKEDGMVRAIRYTVTYNSRGRAQKKSKKAGGPRETLFFYEDYQEVDGLKVPGHFRGFLFVDGEVGDFKNEAWCTDISFSKPFDEAMLQMPEGGRVQPLPGQE